MITDLSQLLKDRGILPTPQRLAVFREVWGRKNHPGVDAVFLRLRQKLPTLSKTTVYSTMQLLADNHLIGRVHVDGDEVRYDGIASFHAHFRCKACGRLFDIEAEAPHGRPFVTMPDGFEPEEEELTYFGICPTCKKKGKSR